MKRILSIDGGGIKGAVPAAFLASAWQKTMMTAGKPGANAHPEWRSFYAQGRKDLSVEIIFVDSVSTNNRYVIDLQGF